jgi:predicted glutamine amidotransferase
MCIAILQTKGKVLSPAQIEKGWNINRDGGGFAYVKDGKVEIEKGFLTLDKFKEAYARATDLYAENSPFLVHMRIRTSGNTDKHNTHPFPVKGGAMIHNGILFTPTGIHAGKGKKQNSDTKVVASSLFNILVKQDLIHAAADIGEVIGRANKFAFLFHDGDYLIINESSGYWADGIWYSNYGCRLPENTASKSGAATPTAR